MLLGPNSPHRQRESAQKWVCIESKGASGIVDAYLHACACITVYDGNRVELPRCIADGNALTWDKGYPHDIDTSSVSFSDSPLFQVFQSGIYWIGDSIVREKWSVWSICYQCSLVNTQYKLFNLVTIIYVTNGPIPHYQICFTHH